jgi:hypothetical protein
MAANKNLDPLSCTTASEAFKYSLPQVRQFHRSLTAELDEKNARLRTLVGGSYRQLLGTAETILQMREDIGDVEEKLGRVGKGCGRGAVGTKASGLVKLQDKGRKTERVEELGWSARMKVLEMCGIVIGRLLRKERNEGIESKDGRGKSLVLAAKVLVLSRLLAKSVGDSASEKSKDDEESVEEAKKKLGALRRRLLRVVERELEKTGQDNSREGLVSALCAYSLATSSGARDVLRHFLHIRSKAMALAFEDEEDQKQEKHEVLGALELYTRTLLDVQAIIPRRLSEALAGLKSKPLLKDAAIRELEGLRLDVCERWFGDEILFFTPYIRHDDLEGAQAVSTLKGWAEEALEVMLQGLSKSLARMSEFKSVVDLRTEILEIWIKEGGKARGFDPTILLDGLREVVNNRMVQLLESRVSKLHLVATEIEATLGSWRDGIKDRQESLWDENMLGMEISNGAGLFKQGILARTHGRSDGVSRVFKGYQTWRHLVDEIIVVLDQLKKQRWDENLEDIDDDLTLESRNTVLSVEDPQMLQAHLDTSLEKAYADLHDRTASLLATYQESEKIGRISIFILRIIRDLRTELPKNASLRNFGLQLVPSLHGRLASTISGDSIETFAKTITKNRVTGRVLWEGNPELPVQPSPSSFKFLHNLALAMTNAGSDLWSPTAVSVLKRYLREEIGHRWAASLRALEVKQSSKVNGETTKAQDGGLSDETNGTTVNCELEAEGHKANEAAVNDDKRKEILIQSLFDVLVLQCSFEVSETTHEDGLRVLESTLESRLELEAASRKRLQQAAKDYWKRTSLLFGLLA